MKKQLVKRNKFENPLTYLEWKDAIIKGLTNKLVCIYRPNIIFYYRKLEQKEVPKKILDRMVKKGVLKECPEPKATYLRLTDDFQEKE